jgi:hypothetical protein
MKLSRSDRARRPQVRAIESCNAIAKRPLLGVECAAPVERFRLRERDRRACHQLSPDGWSYMGAVHLSDLHTRINLNCRIGANAAVFPRFPVVSLGTVCPASLPCRLRG